MDKVIDNLMKRHEVDEINLLINELKILLDQAIEEDDQRLIDNYALKIALLKKKLNDLDGLVDA